MIIKVQGVGNAVNALAYFDKKAYGEITKGIRLILAEGQAEAIRRTPPMAIVSLSGQGGWGKWNRRGGEAIDFNGNEVRGSIKTSVRRTAATASKNASVRGLITSKNTPGIIFQTIGKGAKGNSQFSREVIKQSGSPKSRFIWGAKESNLESNASSRIDKLLQGAAQDAQSRLDQWSS